MGSASASRRHWCAARVVPPEHRARGALIDRGPRRARGAARQRQRPMARGVGSISERGHRPARGGSQCARFAARARETRRGDATLSKFPHRIRGFPGFPISSRTKRVLRRSVLRGASTTPSSRFEEDIDSPRDSASPSSESRGAENTRALHCCTRRRRLSSAHGSDTTFYPVAKSKDDRAVEGPCFDPSDLSSKRSGSRSATAASETCIRRRCSARAWR